MEQIAIVFEMMYYFLLRISDTLSSLGYIVPEMPALPQSQTFLCSIPSEIISWDDGRKDPVPNSEAIIDCWATY
jgi:hypothetical protein